MESEFEKLFSVLIVKKVGMEGFEPPKAEPESAVLPLHHIPRTLILYHIFAFYFKCLIHNFQKKKNY